MIIRFKLNGKEREFDVAPDLPLVDLLRDNAHLTGTKIGCREGTCGTCTVLIDGRPANSCLTLAARCEGADIKTIEGLGSPANPHPIQEALVDAAGVQCGYCTPGIALTLEALLKDNPKPTEADVRLALDGNLCRCTGYVKIFDAAVLAAERLSKGGAK
ncbi:(2Fe-2S)-binding protein [bacterium]|nr:(2Fe-2S)-binding protein [bacterium]